MAPSCAVVALADKCVVGQIDQADHMVMADAAEVVLHSLVVAYATSVVLGWDESMGHQRVRRS